MTLSHRRHRTALVAGSLGVLLALTACTAAPETAPSPSPGSPSPVSDPYAGPAVFVGDELELLLLTADELTGLIPGATSITTPSAALKQVSDGGGAPADPGICEVFYAEQSLGAVGARSVTWETPSDPEHGSGRLYVLQFADESQAQVRMDQLMTGAEQCAEFRKEGPVTFDAVVADPADDVRAFAGTLLDTAGGYDWRVFTGFASVGNVLVELSQPFTGEQTFDAEAVATLLRDRAAEAHGALIDELTASPPTSEQPTAGDASAAWSEWAITPAGVGPIRLGAGVDEALSAVEGAEITEPSYHGGPWTAFAPDGVGTLVIQPVEGGDTVWSVTVGNAGPVPTLPQVGADLPAAGAIRVGALVSEAIEAFPGGTTVTVESSGEHWYDSATRDGRLLRFRADRDAADPAAIVIGIASEDTSSRGDLRFGG